MADNSIQNTQEDSLFEKISNLIDDSRRQVIKAVNTAMVYTYYGVGQYIVEYEQGGEARAEYGKGVLKRLSERLTEKFGKGWSYTNLTQFRSFYITYSKLQTPSTVFKSQKLQTVSEISANGAVATKDTNIVTSGHDLRKFVLPWSHYLILIRIENPQERSFYEIEAYQQQWSVRQLQRQVASSLYERLALSKDKDEVMRLANEGQTIEKPMDIIKNPLVLTSMHSNTLFACPTKRYFSANWRNGLTNSNKIIRRVDYGKRNEKVV